MHVAQHLLGIAHILAEQTEQGFVRLARFDQLHRRNLEAFLEDFARMQRILGAADVGDVADGAHEPDETASLEHRRHDGDVEEMAGAEPRIVGDEHVAGLQRLGRIAFEQGLHGARQRQVEHRHGARRMGQRLALRIEQFAGEVLRLRDHQREGGAADGEPHLLDHVDEAAPHDLERDRIGLDAAHGLIVRHFGRDDRRVLGGEADMDAKIQARVDLEAIARRDDRGRLALLDDRGTGERIAGTQRVAVVDRRFHGALLEPGAALALDLGGDIAAAGGAGEREVGRRPGAADAKIDRLHACALIDRGVAR